MFKLPIFGLSPSVGNLKSCLKPILKQFLKQHFSLQTQKPPNGLYISKSSPRGDKYSNSNMHCSSLRLDLHSTGKNSTRCPVSRWKWGQCLERSDCTLSRMMLVLRMMVVSSMTWPTPCTTNTMCVMSGSRSETVSE